MTRRDPSARSLRPYEYGRADHRWAEVTGLTASRCAALDGQCPQPRTMRADHTVDELCWFHLKIKNGWDTSVSPKAKKRGTQ